MRKLLSAFIFILSGHASASLTTIDFVKLNSSCTLRVVTEVPSKPHQADVLFLTGFSDRADNHKPLFELLANNGFRVMSFDYPSHGETKCSNLDFHNFTSLSNLASTLLSLPAYQSSRPLYLAGWSTGGLLVYRMLQRNYFKDRVISGAVLLAPGISVHAVPGDRDIVTQESLLSNPNPPHKGPISPISPLLFLGFSSSLLTNSVLAKSQDVPKTPVLMILGDDRLDFYADTPDIKNWYFSHKRSSFIAYQCAGAKHEVDNEREPIGKSARQLFLNFLQTPSNLTHVQGPCEKM